MSESRFVSAGRTIPAVNHGFAAHQRDAPRLISADFVAADLPPTTLPMVFFPFAVSVKKPFQLREIALGNPTVRGND